MGGLGIRRSVQLAPSVFLASAAATRDLIHHILPVHLQSLPTPKQDEALALWSDGHQTTSPVDTVANIQRAWDSPISVKLC